MANDFNFKVPDNAQPQGTQENDSAEGTYKKLLGDKPITFFWLLQHYSSENAAAYKAQKAARKQSKQTPTQAVPPAPASTSAPPAVNSAPPPQPYRQQSANNASFGAGSANVYDGIPNGYSVGSGARKSAASFNGGIGGTGEDNYGGTLYVVPHEESANSAAADDLFGGGKASLVFVSYNRRIDITKSITLIGRDSPKADMRMLDAPTVSSLHARITRENGRYFITDLNSLNGTAVDGRRLSPNTPTQLKDHCSIKLGEEKLVFREYS